MLQDGIEPAEEGQQQATFFRVRQVVPAKRDHSSTKSMQQPGPRADQRHIQPVIVARADVARRLDQIKADAAGQSQQEGFSRAAHAPNQYYHRYWLDSLLNDWR